MRKLKKIIALVFVLLFAFALAAPVLAYDGSPPGGILSDNLTLDFLGTTGGAAAAVLLIVQFLKAPLDRIWKIPTRYIAFFFALLILIIVEWLLRGFSTEGWFIILFLQAIIVTMTAMGAYEVSFRKLELKA